MSELGPFYAKRRLNQLRETFQNAPALVQGSSVDVELTTFLEDLADNLAAKAGVDEDQAFFFIIRSMGALAEAYSDSAYEPYGYPNPFEQAQTLDTSSASAAAWDWPVINQPPRSPGDGFSAEFRSFSALKLFGYTVGKTDGWNVRERHQFLSDFMEMELPSIVEATFGNEYGDPMTATRLRKVANVIASNATNFLRNDAKRYRHAIADWEADLAFLETKYYEGAGLKFSPWPSTRAD